MFSEAKKSAKINLKGHWGSAIVVTLVYSLLAALVGGLGSAVAGIGFILALLFSSVWLIGLLNTIIEARGNKGYEVSTLFSGFKESLTTRICLSLLKELYIFLWTLLLVIPGIVKSFSYAVSEYVSIKHPEYSANECITKSRELMDGHKLDLFFFRLSFIGWIILCVLSLGIGFIWLIPYMQVAEVEFIDKNIMKL